MINVVNYNVLYYFSYFSLQQSNDIYVTVLYVAAIPLSMIR